MNLTRYTPEALQQYREKVAETDQLRHQLAELVESSHMTGDLNPAQNLLEEFTLKTQELGDLRLALGPEGRFLAQYGYEKINDHTVLFALPKGTSRLQILQEAQTLVSAREKRDLIVPGQLNKWAGDERFLARVVSSERICIDGHVEGGDQMRRAAQESFVASKGFTLSSQEDLAVAFALHWIDTREPLFGLFSGSNSYCVRATIGYLLCYRTGLEAEESLGDIEGDGRDFAVSARIPLD